MSERLTTPAASRLKAPVFHAVVAVVAAAAGDVAGEIATAPSSAASSAVASAMSRRGRSGSEAGSCGTKTSRAARVSTTARGTGRALINESSDESAPEAPLDQLCVHCFGDITL
jgi:hypothetical protein